MDNSGQYGLSHSHSSVDNTYRLQTEEPSATGSGGSASVTFQGASVSTADNSTTGFPGNNARQDAVNTEIAARSVLTVEAPGTQGIWLPGGIYRYSSDTGDRRFKVLSVDDHGVHIKLFPVDARQKSFTARERGNSGDHGMVQGCPGHSPENLLVSHAPFTHDAMNQLDASLMGIGQVAGWEMEGYNLWANNPRAGYFINLEHFMDFFASHK
ncbi:hypothetical protein [Endozoicomonas sp. SCSIO W0465]|uniref:hypothetical protein n=1 Tax=Endozoicomonas sp. SCSIO W0465 TaxID=2918516 RepID=UPI0020761406|nr:hypothetical protein [Endozoicomonas sp. SCSIO W0465]USE36485.1 hypothetical protein MJO57_31480 [Endozoicomonas sp. SCSIO W0465]